MSLLKIANKRKLKERLNHVLRDERILGDDAVHFIRELQKQGEVYLVGGAIRNILLEESIRDIDLIVTHPLTDFNTRLDFEPMKFKINRLGGAKLEFSKIQIDIWTIHENWASKHKLLKDKFVLTKEIAKGAFYNFDSLVYALRSNLLECYFYNKCAESKTLDIIKHSKKYVLTNPNRGANILRAFFLKEKYKLFFSEYLEEYISIQMKFIYFENKDLKLYFNKLRLTYPKYSAILNDKVMEKYISRYIKKKDMLNHASFFQPNLFQGF